ncbi:MAG TPA: carboxypeptidase regulatory-like domain-containing protein [Acidobacteriaceae bacterium]|nr:carboxypeptidase regulatory-like domain-containing protein [Acidobacteriaceae bacterium]
MRQVFGRPVYLMVFMMLCLGFAGAAYAQQNSEITGIVTDQTGAVISGAQITITDTAKGTSSTTVSNDSGYFSVPGLNPSTYELRASAKGFQSYVASGLVLNVSTTLRSDVKLQVGAEATTVTVQANALQVQTDENVVSTTISSLQVEKIATANRNFAALAAMGLGVSSNLPDNNTPMAGAGGSSFSISANGLRQSHNIWLIDGGESDDRGGAGGIALMPPQDAIAEFTMLTSNYPPDYGISSGATFSLSLKSGTRDFHGTGYEFNRNTAYDANDFFNKYNGAHSPRQVLNYNVYGFNIGGPVWIPGLYNANRNKTFFFVNEEWRNIKAGSSTNKNKTIATADIPKAGQDLVYVNPRHATGNAGIVVPNVGDPAFNAKLTAAGLTPGQPFPGNKIPASLFDPNAVAYLNAGLFPAPSTALDESVETVNAPIKVRDDIVRVDHHINDKWALMAHYMHENDNAHNAKPFLGWDGDTYNTVQSSEVTPSNSAAIKISGSISPTLLVEASMNYDGNIIDIVNSANSALSTLTSKGWNAGQYFNNGRNEIPNVALGAPYGTNVEMGSAPWHNAAEDYEPKVDVSYTSGKHSFKFGFSYNRYTKNQQLFGDANGYFHFNGTNGHLYSSNGDQAACQGSTPAANCVQGDAMVDMLLGLAGSYDQQRAQPIRHYVNQTPSVYAMDTWHPTPRLSLQLGFRYDALPQAWERNNYIANFNPAHFSPTATPAWRSDGSMDPTGPGFATFTVDGATAPAYVNGIDLAGQAGVPRALVSNNYNTWQPRIGFSDDLFGNGKTVLRGGFGTFFERLQGNLIYNSATVSPFSYGPSANQVYLSDPHTSIQSGATATTPFFPGGQYEMAQHFPDPAVAMYSLGLQRELSPSVVWVVQYVGNIAWHQEEYRHDNNFPLTTPMAVRAKGGSLGSYTDAHNGATITLPTAGQGPTANNPNSFRTYQGLGDITAMETNTNGSYNGLQTGLRVQNRWGLSGELDYTYSHEIDIQNADNACCVSNPWNLKYDKGAGNYDRRHILQANYVYALPIFNHSQGLVKSIAGGWEISGTFIDESGTPPTNSTGIGISGAAGDTVGLGGGYTNRANVSGKVHYTKKVTGWFNPAQFSDPTPAWLGGPNNGFGNSHKDAVVGPGRVNFTTSLYKSFAMTERAHIELRFESFNTFNHAEFQNLNTGYTRPNSSGSYGNFSQVNNDWGPRLLELGGKIVF